MRLVREHGQRGLTNFVLTNPIQTDLQKGRRAGELDQEGEPFIQFLLCAARGRSLLCCQINALLSRDKMTPPEQLFDKMMFMRPALHVLCRASAVVLWV